MHDPVWGKKLGRLSICTSQASFCLLTKLVLVREADFRGWGTGHLEWHSAEFFTPHSGVILEWWIGVALHLVECGVQAGVEWQNSTPQGFTPSGGVLDGVEC